MPDVRRILHLTQALITTERRRRGWKLWAFPIGLGLLFLALIVLVLSSRIEMLTPTTRQSLKMIVHQNFTGIHGSTALALALLIVQGPYLLSVFVPILAVLTVRPLIGARLTSGEFERLLGAPYSHDDVFLAFVSAICIIIFAQIAVLAIVCFGGGWVLVLVSSESFQVSMNPAVYLAFLAPIPIGLWATLVATFVYMRYPDTPLNGTSIGNFLLLVAFIPGSAGILLTATTIEPVMLALVAVVGVSIAVIFAW